MGRRPIFLIIYSFGVWAMSALLFATPTLFAQRPPQQGPPNEAPAPAPPRDVSGVWQAVGGFGPDALSPAPEKDMPPMTPWAQAKYDAERPGYGTRAVPDGNDPILQCDPAGFPRVMFFPVPFEFVNASGRILQFFEREHEWRPIWIDGRPLPKDADPTWYGYSVGHWEGDYTLVVESVGLNDRTWLGATGYPHSEEMRVTERYQRVDANTIRYNVTIEDSKAYMKPIVAAQRIMKVKQGSEIEELPCVWSDENSFTKRIREPAVGKGNR